MKLLITGATGLVGKKLVALLLQQGHSVHYLSTSKTKIQSLPNYKGFYWDIQQGEIDASCIDGVEVIVHLAGATIAKRWTKAYKKEIVESRVKSANLLYQLIKNGDHTVKQFISASGTAIYPESFEKVFDESTVEQETSYLSTVVQEWEAAVDQFNNYNIKVCKLRTGVVLDGKEGALPEMAKPIQMGVGANMGNGKQMQSWIHIDDLVQIYSFAIQQQLAGVYNAVSPNPVSNAVLTKAIAKALHKWLFLPNIPRFMMDVLLGEMDYLLFSSKNLSADKIQKEGFVFQYPNIDTALENIYN
jgi:uncharacterized protein (TIGR01777 family)